MFKNTDLNIDIKKILLENSINNTEVSTPIVQEESVSVQRIEENTQNGFDPNDGDVVNPMEFFSE